MPGRKRLTEALKEATGGSRGTVDALFEVCYGELRQLAHRHLASERPGHTLDHARRRRTAKRLGKARRVPLHEAHLVSAETPGLDIVSLDVALSRLQEEMPEKGELVIIRSRPPVPTHPRITPSPMAPLP